MECFIAWSSATILLALGRLIIGVIGVVSAYAEWALLGHGLGVGIALFFSVVFIKSIWRIPPRRR